MVLNLRPTHIWAAALLQHLLEIAEVFGHALAEKIFGIAPRFRLLVLVIEPAADRMMRVVDLLDEIRDRQLQLMQPEPAGFVARRKFQPWPQVKQDFRGLRDDKLAGFEKRRREGRIFFAASLDYRHHLAHAAVFARDIVIGGAGIFQCEAHEFAAALDARPIIKLITHRVSSAAATTAEARLARQFAAKQ